MHLECKSEYGLRENFQLGSCNKKQCRHLCVKTDVNYTSNKVDIIFSIERQSSHQDNPWKVLHIVSDFESAIGILKLLDKNSIVKTYYVLGWYQNGELVKRFSLEDLSEVIK